ncbi:hypothetical protein MNBD_GAMMA11-2893 [hydrothermal vent metagenome]|uniref:Uncharacterized protein n=1 Tax=hydrothermal vent metagenome TaxID=652676 RepID=A0A3B0XNR9_9ZZZZ
MKYKILKYFIAFVLFVFVSFFLISKWFFWEPYGVKRNSLVYMLKVPDVAKNFPVWGTDDSLEYDVIMADGLKPSTTIIRYNSSLSQDKLHKILLSKGYSCETYRRDETVFCEKTPDPGVTFQMTIKIKSSHSYVKIIIIEY